MLARLRRLRWIAPLLVALSPPAAGTLLPAIHPCPIDVPWATEGGAGEHAGHGATSPTTDGPEHAGCHCIGICDSGARIGAVLSQAPSLALGGAALVQSAPASTPAAMLPRARFLHPPATAPPLV